MVLPLIGAGLMLGGTAANLWGSYQRDRATRGALNDYRSAVQQKADQDRQQMEQEAGTYHQLAMDRQGGVGGYIDALSAAQNPAPDAGFGGQLQGALSGIRGMTAGADGSYGYSGAPQASAQSMQGQETSAKNRRLAEAMLTEDQDRRIQMGQESARQNMSIGDILRQAKTTSISQRFQLAKALRELDWQRRSLALQSQLDDASKKGQWMNVLGGLGTQAGGLMMMAGQGGAGGAAGTENMNVAGTPDYPSAGVGGAF